MNRQIEKRLAARAVELGRAGLGVGLAELAGLVKKESVEVRRLAVSAVGKLAGAADCQQAVEILLPVLQDIHPQVRQYAVKALAAYGVAAQRALHDLRDVATRVSEKDYNKRDALKTIQIIEEACRIDQEQLQKKCQRCHVNVSADEFARANKAFQRTADYKIGMLKKQKLYQQEGKKLVSLHFTQKPKLKKILQEKLSRYVVSPYVGETK